VFVANEVCKSARRSTSITSPMAAAQAAGGMARSPPPKPRGDDKPLPISKRPKTPEGPEVVEVSITEVKCEDLEPLDVADPGVEAALCLLTVNDAEAGFGDSLVFFVCLFVCLVFLFGQGLDR
jgi:hypothetical protein